MHPSGLRRDSPLRVLDLYCGQGGSARGFAAVGFQPYGIDTFKTFAQSRYPYPSKRGHALLTLMSLLSGQGVRFGRERLLLQDFLLINASPPCQHASAGTRSSDGYYPKLIPQTRDLLVQTGLPYIIENVEGADLIDPTLLCGTMFNLTARDEDDETLHLQRHRLFETSFPLPTPEHVHRSGVQWAGVYDGARKRKPGQTAAEHRHSSRNERGGGYVPRSREVRERLLGVQGMTVEGMEQCVPPAYTEYIGKVVTGQSQVT